MKSRRPFVRRSASGTARIQRDGYSNNQVKWWDIRKEVMLRDKGRCICGAKATEVHHIIALSRGGTTTKSNLISLCENCHDRRHPGHPKRK